MLAFKSAARCLIGCVSGVALLHPVHAAQLSTESFTAGRAGWTNEGTWTVQATNAYFRGTFASQSIPLPESASWIAGDAASGGAFTGDYAAAGVEMIGFSIYAEHVLPSELQIRLIGANDTFFRSVVANVASTGAWYHIDLSLESAAEGGWAGGDEPAFAAMRHDVRRVTIQVVRSGSSLQRYRLDDVYLGAKPAMDECGLTEGVVAGVWNHVRPGRAYRMEAAADPLAIWTAYGDRVVATGMTLRVTLSDHESITRMVRLRMDGVP